MKEVHGLPLRRGSDDANASEVSRIRGAASPCAMPVWVPSYQNDCAHSMLTGKISSGAFDSCSLVVLSAPQSVVGCRIGVQSLTLCDNVEEELACSESSTHDISTLKSTLKSFRRYYT